MAYLPSEIARLVLGYLKEVSCAKTYQTFMTECPHLSEYAQMFSMGREYPTSIGNRSLMDILSTETEPAKSSPVVSFVNRQHQYQTAYTPPTSSQITQTTERPLVRCDKDVQTESQANTTTVDESIQTISTLLDENTYVPNLTNSNSQPNNSQHYNAGTLSNSQDPILASLPYAEVASLISAHENQDNCQPSGSQLSNANDLFGDPSSVLSLDSISGTDSTPWSSSHFSSPDHNRTLMSEAESLNTPNVLAMTPCSGGRRDSYVSNQLTPTIHNNQISARRNLLNEMDSDESGKEVSENQDLENAGPLPKSPQKNKSAAASAAARCKKSSITAIKPMPNKRVSNTPMPVAKKPPVPRKQIAVPDVVLREAHMNLQRKNAIHPKRNHLSMNAKIRSRTVSQFSSSNNNNKASNNNQSQTSHQHNYQQQQQMNLSEHDNILTRALGETQLPYQVVYAAGSSDSGVMTGGSSTLSDGSQILTIYNHSYQSSPPILMNSSGVTLCSSSELDNQQQSASEMVEIDANLLESVNVEDFLQTHVHGAAHKQ